MSKNRENTTSSHRKRSKSLCLLVLGLLFWLAYLFLPPSTLAQSGGSCPINSFLDGRQLHTEGEPGDRVYIVCVDLTNPYLRFQTVMANDVLNVNAQPDQRETVSSMVNRSPYEIHNPIIAFNADYFGAGHGAEGLTVVNGYRIDGPGPPNYDNDNNEVRRISLSVSRLNSIEISHKNPTDLVSSTIHLSRFYNSVGGGPMLIRNGLVIPNPCPPPAYSVTPYNCDITNHTAAGITEDGKILIIVVAESKTGVQMGHILKQYGAHTGMKLDGDGATQLWFEGDLVFHDPTYGAQGSRIANAILVFREDIPRHDAFILFQSDYPIVKPEDEISLSFNLRNIGFLPWANQLSYGLGHAGGERFDLSDWQPIPETIAPNSDLQWNLIFTAPSEPGDYTTSWQMAYRDNNGHIEPIGPKIEYIITVLPEESTLDLEEIGRQSWEQFLAEYRQKPTNFREGLQQQIQGVIDRDINSSLKSILIDLTICLNSMALIGIVIGKVLHANNRSFNNEE